MPENNSYGQTIYIFDSLKNFCQYIDWKTHGTSIDISMDLFDDENMTEADYDKEMSDIMVKRKLCNGIEIENKRMRIAFD